MCMHLVSFLVVLVLVVIQIHSAAVDIVLYVQMYLEIQLAVCPTL